jgi:hypothetical protein
MKKSGGAMFSPDKQMKTTRGGLLFNLLWVAAFDLEGLGSGARHIEKRRSHDQLRQANEDLTKALFLNFVVF